MNVYPRWYVPEGIARPAHVRLPLGARCAPGVGPDVAGGGAGGGQMIGGTFLPGESGWHKAADGWWVNIGDANPQALVRLDRHPRVLRWEAVPGIRADHWWMVPVLLTPELDQEGRSVIYVTALDQSWRGDRWADPHDLVELQRRLLNACLAMAPEKLSEQALNELAHLVTDLLKMHHDVTADEMIAGGWLTLNVMLRILTTAADVPLIDVDPSKAADG